MSRPNQNDPATFEIVKNKILKHYEELKKLSPKELVHNRMEKYNNMGVFND